MPLGVYYVTEIERIPNGVTVKALDSMVLLDTQVTGISAGTPHAMVSAVCAACGVELATNSTTIATYPNGDVMLTLPEDSNIETHRDLLMWVCQAIGCNARFNRSGALELVLATGGTAVRTISTAERYTSKISDFAVKVTGLTHEDASVGNDDGIILALEDNPLWRTREDTQALLQAILDRITLAEYTPCTADIWGDASLQAGDHLTLEGTQGGDIKALLTSHTWRYRGKHSITSAGEPKLTARRYAQGEKVVSQAVRIADKATQAATAAEVKVDTVAGLLENAQSVYDAAIAELDGEMGSVIGRVGTLESDVSGLQASYSGIHAEMYDTTDGLVKRMTDAESELTVQAGQIAARVAQTEFDAYTSATDGAIESVQSDVADLSATAGEIQATITSQSGEISDLQTSFATQQAQITAQAGMIESKVSQEEFEELADGTATISEQMSSIVQTSDQLSINFQTLLDELGTTNENVSENQNTLLSYFDFQTDGLTIGVSSSELKLKLSNERISFVKGSEKVAYFSDNQLYVTDAHFLKYLVLGNFEFAPRSNGNLSLRRRG